MRITEDLHLCGSCRRPFVVPEYVHEVIADDQYLLELRCTDCGWVHVGAYSDRAVEALDRELDRTQASMQAALELCELTDELERVDRFAAALHAGLILPEDF